MNYFTTPKIAASLILSTCLCFTATLPNIALAQKNKTNVSPAKKSTEKSAQMVLISSDKATVIAKKYLAKNPELAKILAQNKDWSYYKGNLNISQSYISELPTIFEGDITIDGNLSDAKTSNLIILGNLKVKNLLSHHSVYVTGNLTASDLIYVSNNDLLRIDGKVKAKAIANENSQVIIKDLTATVIKNDENGNYDWLYRAINPGLLLHYGSNQTSLPIAPENIVLNKFPSYKNVHEWVIQKEGEFFREKIAPESLLQDLKTAMSSKTNPAEINKIAANKKTDLLILATLALRSDLSLEAQNSLINTSEYFVLANLASNLKTPTPLLIKLAQLSPEIAGFVAENPNCPDSLLAELVNSDNEDERWAATYSKKLTPQQIDVLTADTDEDIRLAVLERYRGKPLSAKAIQNNIRHKNDEIKMALIEGNRYLTVADYETLIKEGNADLQSFVVEHLLDSGMHLAFKNTSATERENVLKNLVKNPSIESKDLKILALSGLPRADQKELSEDFNSMEKDFLNKKLSTTTTDKELIKQYSQSEKKYIVRELACNTALPPAIQLQLFARAPSAAQFNSNADAEDEFKFEIETLHYLLVNLNLEKNVRTSIIEFCSSVNTSPEFCEKAIQLFGLTEKEINLLTKAKDSNLKQIALTGLHAQNYASQEAIQLFESNNPATQQELGIIKKQSGAAFWSSLAKAKSSTLRKIAAINHNTPIEDLTQLRNDKDPDVGLEVLLNPNYPKNLLIQEKFHNINQVRNIQYTDAFLFQSLGNPKLDIDFDIQQEIRWMLWLRNQKKKSLAM